MNDVKPALLAGALAGSSVGKARRETMTMAQYAPLHQLLPRDMPWVLSELTVHPLLPPRTLQIHHLPA